MADKPIKVLGAGSALLDLLVHVDDSFITEYAGGEKGGMTMPSAAEIAAMQTAAEKITTVTKTSGGSTANTLCGLLQLGIPCAFFGKTGKDENGAIYRNAFAAIGGDCSSFKCNETAPTGRCLCLITPDSQRTMRTDLGASGTLTVDDVTDADFEGITHFHIEGYLLYNMPVFLQLIKTAKAHNCTVSLDLASFEVVRTFKADLEAILRDYVDLVFANEDEAKAFSGSEDPVESLNILRKLCNTVCVKVGKDGAYIASEGQDAIHVDAKLVKAVDTTGAGDLWQTGFLYGWLNGRSNALSGKYAAAVAAEVVQITGAQIPAERWDVLRAEISAE